jgi:hypothetical protein
MLEAEHIAIIVTLWFVFRSYPVWISAESWSFSGFRQSVQASTGLADGSHNHLHLHI